MSDVSGNQPLGTPTWIDLGVPDLDRAMDFYGAVLGWEFEVGPEEFGRYTTALRRGRPAAALSPVHEAAGDAFWQVYLATDDVDATVARATSAGATVLAEPMDVMDQGRMAILRDPVGAQVALWQGAAHVGCQVVNEPGALLRNDLITPDPQRARDFYGAVFGFTHDANPDLPMDMTFLRRPDGHEVGGIIGDPGAAASTWTTLFLVEDADAAVRAATQHGGGTNGPETTPYGRMAQVTDPFGAQFSVGSA